MGCSAQLLDEPISHLMDLFHDHTEHGWFISDLLQVFWDNSLIFNAFLKTSHWENCLISHWENYCPSKAKLRTGETCYNKGRASLCGRQNLQIPEEFVFSSGRYRFALKYQGSPEASSSTLPLTHAHTNLASFCSSISDVWEYLLLLKNK